MDNTPVNGFASGAPVLGTDIMYLARSPFAVGDDRKATLTQLAAFISLNLTGDAFIIVGGSTNSDTNGDQLASAIITANAATPHGAAKSASNRFTIFLLPGRYTVSDDEIVLSAQFVDMIGMSTNAGAWAWNALGLAGVSLGDVVISSAGDVLGITAPGDCDVTVANISLVTTSAGNRAFNPTTQGVQFKMINCVVLNSSGVSNAAMAADVHFSGQYVDVRCWNRGSFGFRSAGTANATGIFIRCKAGDFAFASALVDGFGIASGFFMDCEADGASFGRETCSGEFIRCRFVNIVGTASGMFGFSATATVSGTFDDCTANASTGFGGNGGTMSGTLRYCTHSATYTATVTGSILYCDIPGWRTVFTPNTADSATISNTAAETNFSVNVSIPARAWKAAKAFRFLVYLRHSTDAVTAGTITLKVKLGSTTILNSGAFTLLTAIANGGIQIIGELTCRTIGAGGTVSAGGRFSLDDGASMYDEHIVTTAGTVAVDTTAAQTFQVSVQFSVADADNTATLENLILEPLSI